MSDSLVGLMSVAVLGVAGLLMNIVIARMYGAAVLGVFNQVFAIYIFGAQLATFGIQFSVLRYAPEHQHDEVTLGHLVRSGLLLVALTAFATTLLVLALTPVVGIGLSHDVAEGLVLALPGLWAFAVNKYLLNTLNGVRRMKTYSLLLSARYVLLLAGVGAAAMLEVSGNALAAVFTVAEGLLLLLLLLLMRRVALGPVPLHALRTWSAAHWQFGRRSVVGGATSELNTRVDVLVLGVFADDRTVGIFSFAAILVEGLLQIPLVIKRQADPILTSVWLRGDRTTLLRMFRGWRRWTYALMAIVCIAGIAIFPWFTAWTTRDVSLHDAWLLFSMLLIAGTLQSGYIPVSGLLGQAGLPWRQTQFLLMIFASNLLLNVIFVPVLGGLGAALATSAVYVTSIFYLRFLLRRFMALAI